MAFRKMEEVHAVFIVRLFFQSSFLTCNYFRPRQKNQKTCSCTLIYQDSTFQLYLVKLQVVFPRFQFFSHLGTQASATYLSTPLVPVASTSQAPTASASVSSAFASDPHLWTIVDPDIARENPVEDKHRRLVRSHRSSPYDRELKPNAKIRDELGVYCFEIVFIS